MIRLVLCLRRAGAEISPAPVTSAAPVSVSWVVMAALDTSEIGGDTAIATLLGWVQTIRYQMTIIFQEIWDFKVRS